MSHDLGNIPAATDRWQAHSARPSLVPRARLSLLALLLASVRIVDGCMARLDVPVDPQVDFAAHVESRGIVVDRSQNGEPAVLVPAPALPFTTGPTYLLQADDKTIAALWVKDPAHVTVRQTPDPSAPLVGRVEAHWNHGAINLTLKPANGPALHSGAFERIAGTLHPPVLSWYATTVLDVRGVYLAELRDDAGAPAGWFRVSISPYMAASRIYDGVLPSTIQEPLATAAAQLIDSDIDYIESRAVNPYLGN